MGKFLNVSFLSFMIMAMLAVDAQGAGTRRRQRAAEPEEQDQEVSVSLSTTHILPSAFVVPGGQLVLGTTMAIGLFDFLELSTNLFYDFSQVYNVSAKAALWSNENFATAVYATYMSQPFKTVDAVTGQTTTQSVTSIEPGATISYRIIPRLVGHVGASFVNRSTRSISKAEFNTQRTSFIHGTTLNKEFALGLTSKVALALGGSYDLTYDVAGVGSSVYIGGFHIGLHYYFNVSEGSLIPILGGGYTTTF